MGLVCLISQAQEYYVILRSEVNRIECLCVLDTLAYIHEQAAALKR